MDRNAIAALAKGLVPYVREVVAPLDARVAAIEARPIEKGEKGEPGERGVDGAPGQDGAPGAKGEAGDPGSILLPPDLVEQVAIAVRLLHESPPITQHRKER